MLFLTYASYESQMIQNIFCKLNPIFGVHFILSTTMICSPPLNHFLFAMKMNSLQKEKKQRIKLTLLMVSLFANPQKYLLFFLKNNFHISSFDVHTQIFQAGTTKTCSKNSPSSFWFINLIWKVLRIMPVHFKILSPYPFCFHLFHSFYTWNNQFYKPRRSSNISGFLQLPGIFSVPPIYMFLYMCLCKKKGEK